MNDADKIRLGLEIITVSEIVSKLTLSDNRISLVVLGKLFVVEGARMKQLGWVYDEKTSTYTYEIKGER